MKKNLILMKAATDGFFRGLTGFDYCRSVEWPIAEHLADLTDGIKCLDVGSGDASFFPLLLAWQRKKFSLTVLDYSDPMDLLKKRFLVAVKKRLVDNMPEFLNGDIRRLPLPSESFDRVTCVSTIEHIPEDGDSVGIKELVRVLKPGGIMVVTVPMSKTFRDEYKVGKSYEREEKGKLVFFQRIYDFATLESRLVQTAGIQCLDKRFLVEPGRQYFWEQDCLRIEQNGKTVLHAAKAQSRLSRSLMVWRAARFIKVVDEQTAKSMADRLIVGALVFKKPE